MDWNAGKTRLGPKRDPTTIRQVKRSGSPLSAHITGELLLLDSPNSFEHYIYNNHSELRQNTEREPLKRPRPRLEEPSWACINKLCVRGCQPGLYRYSTYRGAWRFRKGGAFGEKPYIHSGVPGQKRRGRALWEVGCPES